MRTYIHTYIHAKFIERERQDRAPPNYVGRMRSNLNFEVMLGSKSKKTAKLQKKMQNCFWLFWQKYWLQRAENLLSLSHHYCLQMLFYKIMITSISA